MLRRLFRNAAILHWSSLFLLEAFAVGTIVLVRVKRWEIARFLHAKGFSESRAIWTSRMILILAVLLPWIMVYVWMWIAVAIVGRVRRKLDRCLRCNYDLRGNTSGICPECGTPVDPNLWPPQLPGNSG